VWRRGLRSKACILVESCESALGGILERSVACHDQGIVERGELVWAEGHPRLSAEPGKVGKTKAADGKRGGQLVRWHAEPLLHDSPRDKTLNRRAGRRR